MVKDAKARTCGRSGPGCAQRIALRQDRIRGMRGKRALGMREEHASGAQAESAVDAGQNGCAGAHHRRARGSGRERVPSPRPSGAGPRGNPGNGRGSTTAPRRPSGRLVVQCLTLLATNANLPGFIRGRIYTGNGKRLCVPGLNCYSCPGAVAACPIGALQAVLGSIQYKVSFYVLGLLAAFGVIFGRFICGFLCPFGLIQEWIHRIPFPRIQKPWAGMRYIKYGILAIFVIALPLLWTNRFGMGSPTFCAYICPAGTLEAGVPLLMTNPPLRQTIGGLFALKAAILAGTVIGCMLIYRFFCRALCPLGAIYSLFNRISMVQLRRSEDACTRCGMCKNACKMGVDPAEDPAHGECIRCGDCVKACKAKALMMDYPLRAHLCGHGRTRREGAGE